MFKRIIKRYNIKHEHVIRNTDDQSRVSNKKIDEFYNYTIKITFTLVDTETGYMERSPWLEVGSDQGDNALYKAYTSGVKYFLLKNFLLPTDDDVERTNIIPKKQVVFKAPQSKRPPIGQYSVKIMDSLADPYRSQLTKGSKFEQ